MNQPVEYYFGYYANFYLGIYPAFALLILAVTIILKGKYRSESYNILYVFNTALAWASLFIVLNFIVDYFVFWYGENLSQWYARHTTGDPNPYTFFYFRIYLKPVIGLLFFFRRLRTNRIITVLFLMFVSIGLVYYLLRAFSDYLPSSWSTYYLESLLDKVINYVVVFFFLTIIYLLANKAKKLPYPSLFLK